MRDDQLDPIIQMCDGHSANKKLNTTTILCNCLAHARRKFYEIDESFPKECRIVLDIFSLIYKNEILAQGLAMDNLNWSNHRRVPMSFVWILIIL